MKIHRIFPWVQDHLLHAMATYMDQRRTGSHKSQAQAAEWATFGGALLALVGAPCKYKCELSKCVYIYMYTYENVC